MLWGQWLLATQELCYFQLLCGRTAAKRSGDVMDNAKEMQTSANQRWDAHTAANRVRAWACLLVYYRLAINRLLAAKREAC